MLAASIAHEVNQPLAGVVLNTSTCIKLLAAEPADVEAARETARRTLRDAERASEVITRLQNMFAGRPAKHEWLDLNDAAREVMALLQDKLQEYRVCVRAELSEELPHIEGDRVQLQQVILNLLLNAAEAMSAVNDRPRALVIRTERDAKRVHFSVRDAGVGFKPQDIGKLFATFYTTKSGGMGLGLPVSRSIIESHHGSMRADLNEEGGATFSFSIPRKRQGEKRVSRLSAIWRHAAPARNGEIPSKATSPRLVAHEGYGIEPVDRT
jgi:C4-dicarboxylate-specific signal transduction histidine kinase